MKIVETRQPAGPPEDKPAVASPVLVTLDRPFYYVSERGPVPSAHPLFCGRAFAETVLAVMHELLEGQGLAVAHVGVYNPRFARRANGKPILPKRWSNHAYGEAMDFKGVVEEGDPDLIGLDAMRRRWPDLLPALAERCGTEIKRIGRRPEIVDEGGWLHIGLWPKK
jgi:hypothetical protein